MRVGEHDAGEVLWADAVRAELLRDRRPLLVPREELHEPRRAAHLHVDVFAEARIEEERAARMLDENARHREDARLAERSAAVREDRPGEHLACGESRESHSLRRMRGRTDELGRRPDRERRRREAPGERRSARGDEQSDKKEETPHRTSLRPPMSGLHCATALASACSKSAQMSSADSMPTDTRISRSLMPRRARSSGVSPA